MSKRCDICSLDLQDEYALQGHLTGKKHLRKLQQTQLVERSIFISPLPKFISGHDLVNFLHQFGTIKWYRFGPNHLIIEFEDRKSTEILLNKPIWVNNTKLDIKKRMVYSDPKKSESKNQNTLEDTCPISYDKIKDVFEKENTFDAKLEVFLNTIQLSDVEIETRYASVCTQLDKIFKAVFPKCKTHKFGSTQTGLGFKECDLDIYMDIGEPVSETKNMSHNSWTMQRIFKDVKRVMYRMNGVFSNIISIPKAKTPIIKFCHVPTNISCDISFKNSLGIHKTYFIKYCISLDDRLRPLMMLIKYWARHFKISGSGKISNYALVLLIIFYLQRPSVNIVPPLMEFQKTSQPRTVNGWQVNFNENVVLPPVTNKNTIPQLLHGFFSFYSTFEFKSQIICPLDGVTHTECEFKEIENLPPCMVRYKAFAKQDESVNKLNVSRPMCVQDPIELSHNVTAGTPFSILDSFVKHCALGAEICIMTSKNDYKNLMETLFMTAPQKSAEDKYKVTILAKQVHNTNCQDESETCTDIVEKTQLTNSHWYFTVFHIVKDIFEKVFMVQVEVLTADNETKQQKIEVLSDVHTKDHQTVILHCTGSYCVWRKRRFNSNLIDPSLSCLEKETLISDQLVENAKKEGSRNVKLEFKCTFEKKTNPLKVLLSLINQNSENHVFQEFAFFAKRKLTEIVDPTLIHMQQFNKDY